MPKNMANYLTIGRVLMIPVFLVLMYVDFPGSRYWALGVYIVACLTDFADGYIARHYNQISDFGKFMDPLADKCLVMAALCCFVEQGDMLAWILAVVLVREFLADTGMTAAQIDRVAYLVGHHHSPAQIDGIDYQILIEADYIVNASESGYDQQAIRTFMEHTMKTAAGIRLTKTVFGV